jgi:hypothetical protein
VYDFTAPLWVWDGDAPWHFVTVPEEVSDDIEARTAHRRSGFGSVRVEVTVGATSWATSLFPDKGVGLTCFRSRGRCVFRRASRAVTT